MIYITWFKELNIQSILHFKTKPKKCPHHTYQRCLMMDALNHSLEGERKNCRIHVSGYKKNTRNLYYLTFNAFIYDTQQIWLSLLLFYAEKKPNGNGTKTKTFKRNVNFCMNTVQQKTTQDDSSIRLQKAKKKTNT